MGKISQNSRLPNESPKVAPPQHVSDETIEASLRTESLDLHEGFCVRSGHESLEAQAKPEQAACFYVHGMLSSVGKQARACEFLEKITGMTIQGVHNNLDPTPLHSVWNALMGLVHHGHGQRVEKQAVNELKDLVREALETGKSVEIFCFSQGTIITKNALQVLQDTSGAEWKDMRDRIQVTFIGAMVDHWPVPNVRGIVKIGDPIVNLTGRIGKIIGRLKDDQGHTPTIHSVEGKGHRLATYGMVLKSILRRSPQTGLELSAQSQD